jgi:hypothetical protein
MKIDINNDREIPAMPKLFNPTTNDTCFFCGAQALFVSFNSKQFRCVEKITQCPGFVKKAEESRQKNITTEQRKKHMKKMSQIAQEKLLKLHQDPEWRKRKGKNITLAKVQNGSAMDPALKDSWKLYEDAVDRVTRESWIYYHDLINPKNLPRGSLYELDHKFSKSEGFKNNVPPEIIGHPSNLEMIDRSENRKKYNKSSISLNDLYQIIKD